MSTLYKNNELFDKTYFQKYPVIIITFTTDSHVFLHIVVIPQGYYDTMDAGYINENGYVFVTARDDDVINVAGHRISTASLGKLSSLLILSHFLC